MPISVQLEAHLAKNVTTVCPLWVMTSPLGDVAAYAQHTRNLTFNSILYKSVPVEISAISSSIGLKPNNVELMGVFDSVVTRAGVEAGRWKMADVVLEYVNYLDLTMGSTGKQVGKVGRFEILSDIAYKVELRSLASVLGQTIGQITSPTDRAAFPISSADLVIDPATYTITRSVSAVTNRREFTVGGAALPTHDYRYGLATWATGANAGLKMEIQESVGNLITLQLPMPETIVIGDTVDLLIGYDGLRSQSRDRFNAVLNFDAEPDLPGLRKALQFPD